MRACALPLVLLAGCAQLLGFSDPGESPPVLDDGGLPPDAPAGTLALEVRSGQGQSATAGTALPLPFEVAVLDAATHVPAADVTVDFLVLSGGGQLSATSVRTGQEGTAKTTLTLGRLAGDQTMQASTTGAQPLVFTAHALPGPAAQLVRVAGDAQSAPAGEPLPGPLVVAVEDTFGNPVAR